MAESKSSESTHRRVPAVTRAIGILRRLGASSEPLGVNQLARELGLVPSTCLHILRVLVDEGLVAFDDHSKRYTVDIGILPIARSAIQRNGFATVIQPMLTDLSNSFGVTAIATQLVDQRQMVVLALSQARQPFRLAVDLGSRFPALISATGRCVAAFSNFDAASLRSGFDRLKWDNPVTFHDWKAQLEEIRRNGYGVDRGAYISGVTIVAVPFFDAEGAVSRSMVSIDITEKIDALGVDKIAGEMLRMRDRAAGYLIGG